MHKKFKEVAFSDLVGKKIVSITKGFYDESLVFITECKETYMMHHNQSCCESVGINDICGDIDDLLCSPVLSAEEVTSRDITPGGIDPKDAYLDESFTWTFYKIDTRKGGVTIRWVGSSNGYYSESVDFEKLVSC